jgi:hypothetical protein
MLSKVKSFVKESFLKSDPKSSMKHFERTVYWLKKLNPESDESLLIAAYAHDIDRAFRKTSEGFFNRKEMNDSKFLKRHQKGGARIMKKFLKENGFPKLEISGICNIISRHEVGGDKESDLIKDADSISYLEVNAKKHIKRLIPIYGKPKVENKVKWMFNRISSKEAKNLAKPFYDKAIKMLGK